MASDRFTFFDSFYYGLKDFDSDTFKDVMIALCEYAFLDVDDPQIDNPVARSIFSLMRPNIDSSVKKREAGKKGGESKNKSASTKCASKNKSASKKSVSKNKSASAKGESNIEEEIEEEVEKELEEEIEREVEVVKEKTKKEKQFDEFWSVYPKKVGKKAAFNAFTKAKVDDVTFDKMLTAVERQKKTEQWQKDGGQFIPHPATWINQGRWDDEEVEIQSNTDYLMSIIQGGDFSDTG